MGKKKYERPQMIVIKVEKESILASSIHSFNYPPEETLEVDDDEYKDITAY